MITALIVLVIMGLYLGFVAQQDGQVLAWFLGALASGALLAFYGAVRTALWRGLALTVAGVILMVAGILGILSIGLPILGAGVLALVAAARARQDRL
ncbi:hypothetical protein AAH991_22960 [Microbispora sp. ZYX-F-249]|uniref:Uncharacterized protein n=1 Tax=Microbispora maris TaxID=3144104 RepID=A0ABV0ARU4_9ACTN